MADNVDVNTDNLDDFSSQFFGKPEAPEPEVEEAPESPSATDEDSTESEPEESTPDENEGDGVDTPAPEDDEPDEDEPEAPKPRGRKPAAERIKELTTRAYEAERRAEAIQKELDAARQKPVEVPVRQTPLEGAAPHPDTLAEDGQPLYPLGEFDPTFIRDLTRFTIRQETEAARKEDEEARQKTETETVERQLLDSWTEKVKASTERLPDLAEKVTELEEAFSGLDPNYGKFIAATLMSLEHGPDVLDYLADHPDEAKRIVNSGATQASIAFGRLEARFDSDPSESGKGKVVQTEAPPPPPRTRGSGGKAGVAADTDDLDAFEKQFFVKK